MVERCRAQVQAQALAGAAAARCVALKPLRAWTVDCGRWTVGCGLWTVNGGVEPEGAPALPCPLLPAPYERWHWVRGDPPNWTFSQARQAG